VPPPPPRPSADSAPVCCEFGLITELTGSEHHLPLLGLPALHLSPPGPPRPLLRTGHCRQLCRERHLPARLRRPRLLLVHPLLPRRRHRRLQPRQQEDPACYHRLRLDSRLPSLRHIKQTRTMVRPLFLLDSARLRDRGRPATHRRLLPWALDRRLVSARLNAPSLYHEARRLPLPRRPLVRERPCLRHRLFWLEKCQTAVAMPMVMKLKKTMCRSRPPLWAPGRSL